MQPKHPRGQILDTPPATRTLQLESYAAMSPWRKLELVEDANQTARLLALSGLAARFPDASEAELHRRLFHLIHGRELAMKIWGLLPDDEDRE